MTATTTALAVASLAAFQSTLGFRTCNFSRLADGASEKSLFKMPFEIPISISGYRRSAAATVAAAAAAAASAIDFQL